MHCLLNEWENNFAVKVALRKCHKYISASNNQAQA